VPVFRLSVAYEKEDNECVIHTKGSVVRNSARESVERSLPALLSADDVHFSYDSHPVLRGISFELQRGVMVGLIGPNGSGKSTLIKLLSKVLRPTQGMIRFRGHDIARISSAELARHVAVVPQDPTVAFSFTGLETVLAGRYPHIGRFGFETQRDLEIVRRAMAFTDTIHLSDRYIEEMSGGERQRVFLARALAQEPELLLLDEPTTHLDINHQIEIMDLIRTRHREQDLTVLSVTHDLNLAAEYCGRLLLMSEGRIVREGSPSQVITDEAIKTVYGADAVVSENPETGAPHIALVPGVAPAAAQRKGIKVHVICGGGTASDLIRRLVIEGYTVTAGVLNEGDSDHRVATSLATEVVTAAPFSPVSESAHARNLELACAADVVVVSRVPIGQGNLRNLDAAIEASLAGARTVIFDSFANQDFCSGKAKRRFGKLIENGAQTVSDISDIFEILHRIG